MRRSGGMEGVYYRSENSNGMQGNNSADLHGSIFPSINEQILGGITVIGDDSSDQITNHHEIHNFVTAYSSRETTLALMALLSFDC
jgi:hypothetical protein